MKRLSSILWFLVGVGALFYVLRHILTVLAVEGPRTDLDIVIEAARRFVAGEPMYRLTDPFEHTKPPLLMGLVFWLAYLPHFWVRLFWDLVVFAMPFLILREVTGSGLSFKKSFKPWALTWVVLYPFWYKEAGYGQYNLFNFWLVLVGLRWLEEGDPKAHFGAGVLAAITLVIKPAQLFLLPILMVQALRNGRRPLGRFVLGGVGLVAGLALIYGAVSPESHLLEDHLQWVDFLKLSTAKHLMGANNYGLPTLLTRLGFGEWVRGGGFTALGLGVTGLWVWVWVWVLRKRVNLALHWSVWLMLAFSPMSWKANFGVFLAPVWSFSRDLSWVGLACFLLISKASEYWIGAEGMQVFGQIAAPLWLSALALYCWGRVLSVSSRS